MVHIPRVEAATCPICKREPRVQTKWWSYEARLVCVCGVSGAWHEYDPFGHPFNQAIAGWPFKLERGEPPMSRKL